MTKSNNPREITLDMLLKILEQDHYAHRVIFDTLSKYQELDKRDRAFINRICNGTVKHVITIDYIINQHASLKINKMKPVIRNILRMSVYQLFYMDQVPVSAICNEAVKISKNRGFGNLSGFINGVLRNISRAYETRDMNDIKYPSSKKEVNHYLSLKYSIPKWIVEKLLSQYSRDIVEEILNNAQKEKRLSIRTNINKINTNELKESLLNQGIIIEEHPSLEYAFEISNYDYIEKLEEFQQGFFTVQDYSSMLVVEAANISKKDFVVDVCAAPGGKSLHAAERALKVSSRDLTKYKVDLINENMKRLGLTNIETKVWDARILDNEMIGKADIVIADVPCSGLGILRRKSDIKLKLKAEQLDELVRLQREILVTISKYVKKDGVLIYSTCTLNRDENISNIEWFVKNYSFKLENLDPYIPEEYRGSSTKEGYLQLIPGIHNTDGFFIARLRPI